MKQLNKLLVVVLVLVLSVVMMPATNVSAAKVKLNTKKVSIYVGGTYKLYVNNTKKKVKWSTSNKKVATVSAKGNIKGKKAGKATITAKVGSKKYKCQVTVKNVISANTKTVNINPGESKKVTITYSVNGTVTYDIKDEDIVSCSWGEFKKDKIKLTIEAEEIGSTTVTVTNTYNNQKIKIKVNVVPAVKIKLPSLPANLTNYRYNGKAKDIYKVTDIEYELDESYGTYDLTLSFSGKRDYYYEGSNISSTIDIHYKLYKDGSVYESGYCYASAVAEGESFAGQEEHIFNLEPGTYVLKLMNGV